jgi:hypothetical protein
MITALRSALLPDFFEEPLMSHYFSKSKSSQKTKKTIQSYMKEQKNILVEVLTQESECREFFLNDDAIQSGLLRKELNEMFNSLKEFTAYGKVKPSDEITDFEEKFILNLQEFITLMIMNPTMNKDQRKAFFNEAKQASAQSDFNRLFFKTVCLSIESSIYEQIKSLSLNFEHRREMIQSSGSWSDYNDLKTEIKSSIAMIDDILDKLESLPPSGLEEYNREVRRLRDDLIEKNKLLQVSATTYQKMYRYLVPKSEKKLLFSGHGELFAEGIYHAHNIQPRK